MSAFGTKRDITARTANVRYWGKADMSWRRAMSAYDPKRTSRPFHCSYAQTKILFDLDQISQLHRSLSAFATLRVGG